MPLRTCLVDGCGRTDRCNSPKSIGYCNLHYQRFRKTGDPLGSKRKSFDDRFWEKVDDSGGPESCWPWTGTCDSNGYGNLTSHGKHIGRASRIAYMLSKGDPGDLHVLHSCDNPPCCNPAHLRAGTRAENMADVVARSRRRRKFSDEVLTEVLNSSEPRKILAKRYGISLSYIGLIKKQYVPGMHRSFTS